jgi:deoxyribose-phosphate aldolase
MTAPSATDLARKLELSLWRPEATAKDIERLCAQAREQKIHGVCVGSSRVELAAALLEETDVKVTALIGFPLGTTESDVKRYEAEAAIDCGAQEIEIVLNAGRLKDGDRKYILRELRDLAEAADERPVKVILETQLLTREETLLVCELAMDSGVHFVCAGTGLNGAAKIEDVKLLREAVGPKFGVKAPADIRDAQGMLALIAAGANRIGINP